MGTKYGPEERQQSATQEKTSGPSSVLVGASLTRGKTTGKIHVRSISVFHNETYPRIRVDIVCSCVGRTVFSVSGGSRRPAILGSSTNGDGGGIWVGRRGQRLKKTTWTMGLAARSLAYLQSSRPPTFKMVRNKPQSRRCNYKYGVNTIENSRHISQSVARKRRELQAWVLPFIATARRSRIDVKACMVCVYSRPPATDHTTIITPPYSEQVPPPTTDTDIPDKQPAVNE